MPGRAARRGVPKPPTGLPAEAPPPTLVPARTPAVVPATTYHDYGALTTATLPYGLPYEVARDAEVVAQVALAQRYTVDDLRAVCRAAALPHCPTTKDMLANYVGQEVVKRRRAGLLPYDFFRTALPKEAHELLAKEREAAATRVLAVPQLTSLLGKARSTATGLPYQAVATLLPDAIVKRIELPTLAAPKEPDDVAVVRRDLHRVATGSTKEADAALTTARGAQSVAEELLKLRVKSRDKEDDAVRTAEALVTAARKAARRRALAQRYAAPADANAVVRAATTAAAERDAVQAVAAAEARAGAQRGSLVAHAKARAAAAKRAATAAEQEVAAARNAYEAAQEAHLQAQRQRYTFQRYAPLGAAVASTAVTGIAALEGYQTARRAGVDATVSGLLRAGSVHVDVARAAVDGLDATLQSSPLRGLLHTALFTWLLPRVKDAPATTGFASAVDAGGMGLTGESANAALGLDAQEALADARLDLLDDARPLCQCYFPNPELYGGVVPPSVNGGAVDTNVGTAASGCPDPYRLLALSGGGVRIWSLPTVSRAFAAPSGSAPTGSVRLSSTSASGHAVSIVRARTLQRTALTLCYDVDALARYVCTALTQRLDAKVAAASGTPINRRRSADKNVLPLTPEGLRAAIVAHRDMLVAAPIRNPAIDDPLLTGLLDPAESTFFRPGELLALARWWRAYRAYTSFLERGDLHPGDLQRLYDLSWRVAPIETVEERLGGSSIARLALRRLYEGAARVPGLRAGARAVWRAWAWSTSYLHRVVLAQFGLLAARQVMCLLAGALVVTVHVAKTTNGGAPGADAAAAAVLWPVLADLVGSAARSGSALMARFHEAYPMGGKDATTLLSSMTTTLGGWFSGGASTTSSPLLGTLIGVLYGVGAAFTPLTFAALRQSAGLHSYATAAVGVLTVGTWMAQVGTSAGLGLAVSPTVGVVASLASAAVTSDAFRGNVDGLIRAMEGASAATVVQSMILDVLTNVVGVMRIAVGTVGPYGALVGAINPSFRGTYDFRTLDAVVLLALAPSVKCIAARARRHLGKAGAATATANDGYNEGDDSEEHARCLREMSELSTGLIAVNAAMTLVDAFLVFGTVLEALSVRDAAGASAAYDHFLHRCAPQTVWARGDAVRAKQDTEAAKTGASWWSFVRLPWSSSRTDAPTSTEDAIKVGTEQVKTEIASSLADLAQAAPIA